MLKLDACVGCCEVPVGLGVVGVAVVLRGGDFVDEGRFVGDAAVRASSVNDAPARRFISAFLSRATTSRCFLTTLPRHH